MIKYLLRLDDACHTMNRTNWNKVESILDKYKIKPMVGIIPDNKDVSLEYDKYDNDFLEQIITW
jgi:hypothetical protein